MLRKTKLKNFLKATMKNRALWLSLFAIGTIALTSTDVLAGTIGDQKVDYDEAKDDLSLVWTKASELMSGGIGKLSALGIFVASIIARERIGGFGMGMGIASAIAIPLTPKIIDGFTFLI